MGAHPYNPPHLIPLVELTSGDKTDPALRRREVFPLTDEGRAAAAQYLKDAYDAEPERWNNCPDMMDCDPWEPSAEPDTANE